MAMGGRAGEINMTPLIDVLLVLLIIFMVITPETKKGLDATVPQPAPQDSAPDRSDSAIVLSVDKNQSIRINQEEVLLANLESRLVEIFKGRAEKVCFVKGDQELEFQEVAMVIDTARGAGIFKVGLMNR